MNFCLKSLGNEQMEDGRERERERERETPLAPISPMS